MTMTVSIGGRAFETGALCDGTRTLGSPPPEARMESPRQIKVADGFYAWIHHGAIIIDGRRTQWVLTCLKWGARPHRKIRVMKRRVRRAWKAASR